MRGRREHERLAIGPAVQSKLPVHPRLPMVLRDREAFGAPRRELELERRFGREADHGHLPWSSAAASTRSPSSHPSRKIIPWSVLAATRARTASASPCGRLRTSSTAARIAARSSPPARETPSREHLRASRHTTRHDSRAARAASGSGVRRRQRGRGREVFPTVGKTSEPFRIPTGLTEHPRRRARGPRRSPDDAKRAEGAARPGAAAVRAENLAMAATRA